MALMQNVSPAHMRYWVQLQDTHTPTHTPMYLNTCKLHQNFPQTATNLAEMLYLKRKEGNAPNSMVVL